MWKCQAEIKTNMFRQYHVYVIGLYDIFYCDNSMNLSKKSEIFAANFHQNFHQKKLLRKEKKGKTRKNTYIFTSGLKSLGAESAPNRGIFCP